MSTSNTTINKHSNPVAPHHMSIEGLQNPTKRSIHLKYFFSPWGRCETDSIVKWKLWGRDLESQKKNRLRREEKGGLILGAFPIGRLCLYMGGKKQGMMWGPLFLFAFGVATGRFSLRWVARVSLPVYLVHICVILVTTFLVVLFPNFFLVE